MLNVATYTLTDEPSLISRIVSIPFNEATPIMLSNHIYWNLGAFVDEQAVTVLNDTLYMPYADRVIDTDGILIPNGKINITNGTAYDFTKPGKQIGEDIQDAFCGTGCQGYDTAFILDRPRYAMEDPELEVLKLWAPSTGIQMSLSTNEQGLQIYSCDGQDGTTPVKDSQQHLDDTTYLEQYGCVVIETQDVSLTAHSLPLAPSQCRSRVVEAYTVYSGSTASTTPNGAVTDTRSSDRRASLPSTGQSTSSALWTRRAIREPACQTRMRLMRG